MGITRPQFSPTCVAETSILPVAIVVLVMDFIIVGALLVQASSLGMFGDRREDRKAQSRALLLVIAGFTVWTMVCAWKVFSLRIANNFFRQVYH